MLDAIFTIFPDQASAFKTSDIFAAYTFGFTTGVRNLALVASNEKRPLLSKQAGQRIIEASQVMAFSQRALRMLSIMQVHDIRRIKDADRFLVLDSIPSLYVTMGSIIGAFFANSAFICVAWGRNTMHTTGGFDILLNACAVDKSALSQLTMDQIIEKTRWNEMEQSNPEIYLTTIKVLNDENDADRPQHELFRNGLGGSFANLVEVPLTIDESESTPGERAAPCISLKLARPRIKDYMPADKTERDGFLSVIQKNPGYGQPFLEFIRTIANDYGGYFLPSFSLREEKRKTMSPAEIRRFIDKLDDLTVRD